MTLQVLGVGFGRTGTLSLKAALERLGIGPCHHMFEAAKNPQHARAWTEAKHGAPVDWEALLAGYRAAVDWPAAAFWRELLAAFPAMRVILTTRESAAWYASFRDTILGKTSGLAPPKNSSLRALYDVTHELILDGVFCGRAADEAFAIAVYEAHNRAVVDSVAPERLLLFDPAAGWEPLCRFLARPVPAGAFPHLNMRAAFLDDFLDRGPRAARGAQLGSPTRS
jgi:hypothetical protein